MEKDPSQYQFLYDLDSLINDMIPETEEASQRVSIFKILKEIIQLKINVEEVRQNFDEVRDIISYMSDARFDRRIEIPNRKSLFTFIATGINLLNEELGKNAEKRIITDQLVELIPGIVLVTDLKGVIRYANSEARNILQYPNGLIKLVIANIFKTQKQFGTEPNDPKIIENETVAIRTYNSNDYRSFSLTIKELFNDKGVTEAYIYLLKEIKEHI